MIDIYQLYREGRLFDGHYKLLEPLSTAGGSADVWLAIDTNTIDIENGDERSATKVAIKVYRPKNFIDVEGEYQFRMEFKKVFGCHHENIIQPTYFNIYDEIPYLVLPYCPAGSAEQLICNISNADELWRFIEQVAAGLAYLHEHKPQIIHQDIKPGNVLIDDNGNYAITDFGISAEIGGSNKDYDSGGTFAYMAPERFVEGTPPMTQSDIWALGATLYELVTGQVPFGNEGGSSQIGGSTIPAIQTAIPADIKKLIYRCLASDPNSRPTAQEIVDMVRHRRSKWFRIAIAIGALAIIAIIAVIISMGGNSGSQQYDSLYHSADSIIESVRYNNIESLTSDDALESMKNARAFYAKICDDAPADYANNTIAGTKLQIVDSLIVTLNRLRSEQQLTQWATETEMEDSAIVHTLKQEEIKQIIKNLISDF